MTGQEHLRRWLWAVAGRDQTERALALGHTLQELALKALLGDSANAIVAQSREAKALPPPPEEL